MKFVWAITLLSSIIASINYFSTIQNATSAPQQAAGAAMSLFILLAPYVIARALEKIFAAPLTVNLSQSSLDRMKFDAPTGLSPTELPILTRHSSVNPTPIDIGDSVTHKTFGTGQVVSRLETGDFMIRFESGHKPMRAEYLKKV